MLRPRHPSAPAPPSLMPSAPPPRRSVFWHPLTQVGFCVLSGTAAEVLLKKGAAGTADLPSAVPWLGLTGLNSGWTWLSIVCTLAGFFSWMSAIRVLPLGVAFPLTNAVQVLVPLSCWYFLGEAINPLRWCGIALVVVGLLVVARTYANVESRL